MAIIVGLVHVFMPFTIIPIYSSLRQMDKDEISAAKNLGANKIQAFYEVTLPQSLPGVAASTMLVFIMSFGAYVTPILLGGQKNSMIANFIAAQFLQLNNWELGSAMSIVFIAIVLGLLYWFNRFIGLEGLYSPGGESE
jgi:ABC-type spermidine/putrescine transport system permease subunit I